jgi:hypothetical protein
MDYCSVHFLLEMGLAREWKGFVAGFFYAALAIKIPFRLRNRRHIFRSRFNVVTGAAEDFAIRQDRLAAQSIRHDMIIVKLSAAQFHFALLALSIRAGRSISFHLVGEFPAHYRIPLWYAMKSA